jgi:hypothetical protein
MQANGDIDEKNLHQAVGTMNKLAELYLAIRSKSYLSRNTGGNNDDFGPFKGFIELVSCVTLDLVR